MTTKYNLVPLPWFMIKHQPVALSLTAFGPSLQILIQWKRQVTFSIILIIYTFGDALKGSQDAQGSQDHTWEPVPFGIHEHNSPTKVLSSILFCGLQRKFPNSHKSNHTVSTVILINVTTWNYLYLIYSIPKSASFNSPFSLMSRFCGFKSRCNTFLLWQYAKPRRIWYKNSYRNKWIEISLTNKIYFGKHVMVNKKQLA